MLLFASGCWYELDGVNFKHNIGVCYSLSITNPMVAQGH